MKQAVCLLIEKDGRYLGVGRPYDHETFGLPGGKVDPGETPIKAAVRELEEETNLKTTEDCLTEVFKEVCESDIQQDAPEYETITYSVSYWTGDPEQGDAGLVKWLTKEELMSGPFGDYNQKLFNKILDK